MPEFGTAHSVIDVGQKLSQSQLIRAIRMMVAAEYEAVQMYMQVVESTDDELAKKVLTSVSEEELVHAGEFLTLLNKLSPEDLKFAEQGKSEVEGVKKEKPKDPEDVRQEKIKNLFKG